jgi:RNA polymerase sigma factor (sigma-70 family)
MKAKNPLEPLTLRALVLCARGAKELSARNRAYDRLVILLQDYAVGAAYTYVRDAGLAEDAAQESFVIAWRQLDKLRDPNLFVPWLKRIIASQCHRVLRKKSNHLADMARCATLETEDLEVLVGRRERAKLLREALEHLPASERMAIILFHFAGRSHAAIASFLGVPKTTILKRLFFARQHLKAALMPLRAEIQVARPSRGKQFAMMVRAGIYKDYVGLYRYDDRPELTVRIERVGVRLVSYSADQKHTVLPGARLSELRAKEFDGRAQFVRTSSGRISHFVYYEFGKRMGLARKIE